MLHLERFDTQTQDILKEIEHLFEKYEFDEVYVFGSRSRGDHRDDSDIDLIYSRTGQYGIFDDLNILNFSEELQEYAFGGDHIKLDDVINEDNIIASRARKEMILAYEKES